MHVSTGRRDGGAADLNFTTIIPQNCNSSSHSSEHTVQKVLIDLSQVAAVARSLPPRKLLLQFSRILFHLIVSLALDAFPGALS